MSLIGTLKGSSTIMYTTLQHQPWRSGTPRLGLELALEVTPFAERKGLVMLQPSTCRHGKPVTNEIHALHSIVMEWQLWHNVFSILSNCYVKFDKWVP